MDSNRTDIEVMTAYLRNPSASTGEIAQILDMSRWTVSKSRKRLIESGILRFVWVPDFSSIGAEILFSGFGMLKRADRSKNREIPDTSLFFTSVEDNKGFGIGISRDYTAFYEELFNFSERFGNLETESFGMSLMPVEVTDIWRIADFYPLISSEYGIEVPEIERPPVSRTYSFKEGEGRVYAEIVEHPDWSGEKIAEKLGTSRQRVLRLREKFEKEGVYEKKAVVNLGKLGYEVMLFVSWRMKAEVYGRMIKKIDLYPLCPIILGASTPIQGIAVAAFRNFRKSREIIAQLSSWTDPDKNIMEEPEMLFLSVQDAEFSRYFHFGKAVKRVLGI